MRYVLRLNEEEVKILLNSIVTATVYYSEHHYTEPDNILEYFRLADDLEAMLKND